MLLVAFRPMEKALLALTNCVKCIVTRFSRAKINWPCRCMKMAICETSWRWRSVRHLESGIFHRVNSAVTFQNVSAFYATLISCDFRLILKIISPYAKGWVFNGEQSVELQKKKKGRVTTEVDVVQSTNDLYLPHQNQFLCELLCPYWF